MDSNKLYEQITRLKEHVFYMFFLYGNFDLDLMRKINIAFDNLLKSIDVKHNLYKT